MQPITLSTVYKTEGICQYIGVLDGIWTHAIRSHNPLLYLTELLTQCWWKDSNFQLLPYESSLLPLKYINYYSSWPMLGWWELNSPVTNYSFSCLSDRGDTSQCAEKVGIEPQLLVLDTSVLPIELLPNYLVAGSGFAPLVSPLWVGQDYYFSNLLKHQIIDYFSLLHSENFQKWWHQVLQATWLNSLQKFLRDL